MGANHSWSVIGHGIARSLKNMGHEVHLVSTDGITYFPNDLKENLIGYLDNKTEIGRNPDSNYDCQISYTAMKNFKRYLSYGNKNRFGIFCYEWAGKNCLPTGFAKAYNDCDFLCAPSQFSKRVFLESNIPENRIKVIPHGINVENYKKTSFINLNTNKKFKLGLVLGQNHLRKNINGTLEAYGKAFTKKDDVCLIIKGKDKVIQYPFDISLTECINSFKNKFKNHADIIILSDFINDMSDFYRSIDASYSLPFTEGFHMPSLEAIACGKLSIVSGWGGQVDFLDDTNSLLVSGKEVRADPKSMYWENKMNAIWFQPSIDDAVEKLRYAYNNFETINEKINNNRNDVYTKYSWENVTKQFLSLCQ